MNQLIHVTHHRADQIQFVKNKMEQDHVHALMTFSEIHILGADLNVQQMPNAQLTWLVSIKNVKILVWEFVDLMRNVEYSLISHYVPV